VVTAPAASSRSDPSDSPPYGRALALLLAVTALLHVLAWPSHPRDVDPVNFVAALARWDVSIDAPHPPGYPLYVVTAQALSALAPGIAAYQLLNLLLLLAAGALLYAVLRRVDRLAALAAAALLVTHPLAWAATVTSDCYVLDVFGSVAVLAAALWSRRMSLAPACALMLAVYLMCAFLRPVSVLMLLPLGAVAAAWTGSGLHVGRLLAIPVVGCVAGGIGYVATALLAGGFATYDAAADRVMGVMFRESSVLGGAPVAEHARMLAKMVGWFVLLALPNAALLLLCARERARPSTWPREALFIGLAWLLPPLGFYAAVYYVKPTHHLIVVPALVVLGAVGLAELGRRLGPRLASAPLLAIAALQVAFFWFGPSSLPTQAARLTRGHLVRGDAAWDALARALANERAAGTLVVYRAHPELPFQTLRLMHDGPQAVVTDDGAAITTFDPRTGHYGDTLAHIPADTRRVVVIDSLEGEAVTRARDLRGDADRSLRAVLAAAVTRVRGTPGPTPSPADAGSTR
jgi:hypothetical protein